MHKRIAALAAVVATVALTGAGSVGAVGRYTDATGDGKGAADIAAIGVVSDATGQLVFTVITAGGNPEANGGNVTLFLDTDMNAATGAPGTLGADYVFGMNAEGYGFGRWTGTAFDWDTPFTTVRVATSSNGAMFSVNRTELGGTEAVNFWAQTFRGDPATTQEFDEAPDDGTFNYTLAAGGPEIRQVFVEVTPKAGPRAGARFSVQPTRLLLPFSGAAVVTFPAPESFTCAARLGTRVLRGTGAGGCTFAISRNAKGKRLTIAVTANYQGASKTTQLTYRVR